jgi:guanyl-specific ribonuclease Sa
MRLSKPLIVLALLLGSAWLWHQHAPLSPPGERAAQLAPAAIGNTAAGALPDFLPAEARDTLMRIAHGGPFMHRQDGVVFGNYEHLLPPQPRGYYHEYTVETPGARTRGTRRIITGGDPPVVYYYTGDHYRSFRRFQVAR